MIIIHGVRTLKCGKDTRHVRKENNNWNETEEIVDSTKIIGEGCRGHVKIYKMCVGVMACGFYAVNLLSEIADELASFTGLSVRVVEISIVSSFYYVFKYTLSCPGGIIDYSSGFR